MASAKARQRVVACSATLKREHHPIRFKSHNRSLYHLTSPNKAPLLEQVVAAVSSAIGLLYLGQRNPRCQVCTFDIACSCSWVGLTELTSFDQAPRVMIDTSPSSRIKVDYIKSVRPLGVQLYPCFAFLIPLPSEMMGAWANSDRNRLKPRVNTSHAYVYVQSMRSKQSPQPILHQWE